MDQALLLLILLPQVAARVAVIIQTELMTLPLWMAGAVDQAVVHRMPQLAWLWLGLEMYLRLDLCKVITELRAALQQTHLAVQGAVLEQQQGLLLGHLLRRLAVLALAQPLQARL
jgi:hypothetical protein